MRTRRPPEQIEAEAKEHGDPERGQFLDAAQLTVGMVLRLEAHDIPPDKLKWLQGFLRERLSRPEYREIAEGYGWSIPAKHMKGEGDR